jgi:hypothetical protein
MIAKQNRKKRQKKIIKTRKIGCLCKSNLEFSMRSNRRLLEAVLSFCPLRCTFCVPVQRPSEGKNLCPRLLFCYLFVLGEKQLGRKCQKCQNAIAVVARSVCRDLEPGKTASKSRLLDRIAAGLIASPQNDLI